MSRSNPSRKSVMAHSFAQVPNVTVPRSSFDRSHGWKGTFDGGYLIPVLVDEALPGDTFNVSMSAFARLATPLKPVMDNMFLESFFFAIPYRLIWDNWERFHGQQDNPGDSTDFILPQLFAPAGIAENSLYDYMGLPVTGGDTPVTNVFGRAYNLVWGEWFRSQDLQDSPVLDRGDGPDSPDDYPVRRRGKRFDYFTSCLPFAQKGDPVSIPLGQTAPVLSDDQHPTSPGTGVPEWIHQGAGSPAVALQGGNAVATALWDTTIGGGSPRDANWSNPALFADLSAATATTINDLRLAFQTQRMLERDARGGTRYTEVIRSHFGVTSPDMRLQRPEYLGGGSTRVNITPVAQTSMSASDVQTANTPQGNLAAVGTVSMDGHGFSKSFTEHCIILGLVSVRADLTYQQGINRMWSRRTRFDFYYPSLAHIGEQAVLNKEIYSAPDTFDDDVWGYNEAWSEYRYKPSVITSSFRSSATTPLDFWHLSQDFDARPALNSEFIEDDPPIDRIIAVPSEPHFLFDAYFHMRCARPMPLYGVPGLIDHF